MDYVSEIGKELYAHLGNKCEYLRSESHQKRQKSMIDDFYLRELEHFLRS